MSESDIVRSKISTTTSDFKNWANSSAKEKAAPGRLIAIADINMINESTPAFTC